MLNLEFQFNGETKRIQAPLPGDFEAVFFFSVHKAGSSMFDAAVRMLADASMRPVFDVEQQCFDLGLVQRQWPPEIGALFNLDGYLHTSFRGLPPNISYDMLARRRKVVLVRNPLDCMVSYYYSVAKSHVLPDAGPMREWILDQRHDALAESLESFVREGGASFIAGNLRSYIKLLIPRGSTRVYRYEDIIFKKREWLIDMTEYAGIQCDQATLDRILEAIDIKPEKENVEAHVRQVSPGQHKNVLSAETIALIKSGYADVFDYFGY